MCPILVGFTTLIPKPNPVEVEEIIWKDWSGFVLETEKFPERYATWTIEETQIIKKSKKFQKLYKEYIS